MSRFKRVAIFGLFLVLVAYPVYRMISRAPIDSSASGLASVERDELSGGPASRVQGMATFLSHIPEERRKAIAEMNVTPIDPIQQAFASVPRGQLLRRAIGFGGGREVPRKVFMAELKKDPANALGDIAMIAQHLPNEESVVRGELLRVAQELSHVEEAGQTLFQRLLIETARLSPAGVQEVAALAERAATSEEREWIQAAANDGRKIQGLSPLNPEQ